MIIERAINDALTAATGVAVYFGAQPQGTDEAPSKLPVIVINRPDALWPVTNSGTDTDLAMTTIQVDYYAEGAEDCRRLADTGRAVVRDIVANGAALCPGLRGEQSFYDQVSRAWRVLQTWEVADYAPALA